MPDHSQEDYLKTAKRELGLTWDELAAQAGIHPRALKTYRMPVTSKDHRARAKQLTCARVVAATPCA